MQMPMTATPVFHQRLMTLLRHRWQGARAPHALLSAGAAERLRQLVAASERRHSGQIRICVEGSLPLSYLLRHVRGRVPMAALVRQRALMQFAKQRVWDTERNNGALIYLLVAERAIEIVADRALARTVPQARWSAMAAHLGASLHAGRFEDGLAQAVADITTPLVATFPRADATAARNELPDTPVIL